MESDFFEQLAPYYRDYARRRRAYLDAVDDLVVQGIRGRTLLDVGSGDGSRIVKIACRAGVERLALCEPSAAMRRLCLEAGAAAALAEAESGGPVGAGAKRAREGDAGLDAAVPRQRATPAPQLDVLDLRAEDLDRLPERFESVTCLWNVLGHIPGRDVRVSSLRNMARCLEGGGVLQLDVNNRYNVRAYGVRTVAGNRWRDWRHPGGADGERPLAVVIGGRTLCGRGYVFSPREMDSIIAEAGLRIVERVVIDYQTGQVRRTPCEGQLFYRLVRGNRGSLAD